MRSGILTKNSIGCAILPHPAFKAIGAPGEGILFYKSMHQHPVLIDKKTLARSLGVSIRTVTALTSAKRIPVVRITPKIVRFNLQAVLSALEYQEISKPGFFSTGAVAPSAGMREPR